VQIRALLTLPLLLSLIPAAPTQASAISDPLPLVALQSDAQRLFQSVLPGARLEIHWQPNPTQNRIRFLCFKDHFELNFQTENKETAATLSSALHELGFLFPHPRMTLTPTASQLRSHCHQSWAWKPQFEQRGFHIHTQHPSEWVDGFFQGQTAIAQDLLFWLYHNQQNILQLQLLRTADLKDLPKLIELAHQLQINFGLSISLASVQQRSYALLSPWAALTNWGAEDELRRHLQALLQKVPADFVAVELGQSEFTSTNPQQTLAWLQIASDVLQSHKIPLWTKIHVSTNQTLPQWGNYNFLPRFTDPRTGIQVHTVFFYGLNDPLTPVYGRQNFSDLRDFLLTEGRKRNVWYFPETSYYVGLDLDVPLFLTDYLLARAEDSLFVQHNQISGVVNFSTGQELGYWLMDWNQALQTRSECLGDAFCGLRLLGESQSVWKPILDWQHEFLKVRQGVALLTAENLMDELPFLAPIHDRILWRDLYDNPPLLSRQVDLLQEAWNKRPDLSQVHNSELKTMLQVTELRVRHGLALRRALLQPQQKDLHLNDAKAARDQAEQLLQVLKKQTRYPESLVFLRRANPTSYREGYGFTASETFFWRREEGLVEQHKWNPFFENLYELWPLFFD